MYNFVAGDISQSGITNMESVKRCLQIVVGKHIASAADIERCDFNSNGQIDLDDTFKILQIAEQKKHALYIQGKNVCIDHDMINGNVVLGVIARFNSPLTPTTTLDSNWTFTSHENVVYIENVGIPSFQRVICSTPSTGFALHSFEIIHEKDETMYYTYSH